jgi:predicted phosphate transport protein (TIGR00153 family)
MNRVKRREDVFYRLFREYSEKIVAATEVYCRIFMEYPQSKVHISSMKDYENVCDDQAKKIFMELSNSFITPFDREDINLLVRELDHIADGMDNAAARFDLYDIDEMRPEAIQMADLILQASKELEGLFEHFENFKKDPVVREKMHTVGTIEDEGDTVSRHGLANIFREYNDAIEVLKWKSLIDTMESTVDSCKGVANVVRSVLMKNA